MCKIFVLDLMTEIRNAVIEVMSGEAGRTVSDEVVCTLGTVGPLVAVRVGDGGGHLLNMAMIRTL